MNRLSKQRALSVGSLSDEEWEGDIVEGDDVSDLTDGDDVWDSPPPRRIKTRSTIRDQGRTDLPFSPRKTRPRNRVLSESESSEMGISDDVGPTRRSNRIRKPLRTNAMDDDYEDGESDSLSDERVSPVRNSLSKAKVSIPKRGKTSRAAYGHIRGIVDLEYDELENGPLSAHRHTCERCQRQPTHVLLKRQRRSGKRHQTKRKPKDDFDEDSDSQDKLASLGGWVRWYICTFSP